MTINNLRNTVIFTLFLSLFTIISAFLVQKNANNNISKCSYLDPILIDVLAFLAALFLLIEGVYSIMKNKNQPLRQQWTRSIRIAFGCGILTLHLMQFLHK